MAIQTRIAPHFGWKYLIMAVVCLVLGLWGVYDYVEVIPSRIQAHERGDTARAVRDAIVPGAPGEARNNARAALAEERERFAERFPDAAGSGGPLPHDEDEAKELAERVAAIADSVRGDDHSPWAKGLALFDTALAERPVQEGPLTGVQLHAFEVADRLTQHVATIKRPSFYDRPTQWAFIACLPFVPWSIWVYFATKKRVYRLDDDGTLHLSDAAAENAPRAWKQQDIRDIDMSQWMRKSIAWLEHVNGTRIKLDDYKHKNLHLIIGAIASRLYPDEWDAEAKPVKAKRNDAADQTPPEKSAAAATVAEDETEKA